MICVPIVQTPVFFPHTLNSLNLLSLSFLHRGDWGECCVQFSVDPALAWLYRASISYQERRTFQTAKWLCSLFGEEFVGADEGRLKEAAACPVACSKNIYSFKTKTSCFSGNRDTFAGFRKKMQRSFLTGFRFRQNCPCQ